MKVAELIAILSQCSPDANIGVSMTSEHGWVQAVSGVQIAKDGTVCVDQGEHTLSSSEFHHSEFKEIR